MAFVTKEYECENCGVIEIFQKHTSISKKCPTCKSPIERLISRPLVAKDGAPRTVGMQMEINNRKNKYSREKAVGGEEKEKKLQGEAKWRKLANATPEQKQRYIDKGVI